MGYNNGTPVYGVLEASVIKKYLMAKTVNKTVSPMINGIQN